MRIILTSLGDGVLKNLHEEDRVRRSREDDDFKHQKINELKAVIRVNDEKLNVSGFEIQKPIKVRQGKINLPKTISERYNNDNNVTSLLPQLNLTKKGETNLLLSEGISDSTLVSRLNFKIKDIVQEKSLSDLRDKIKRDKRVKDLNTVIDKDKFRSVYESSTELGRLEDKLNKEISPEKVNLIKYLNQKDILSEKFLDKIVTYDEVKAYKLNKMCQIAFHKQLDDELYQSTIKKNLTIQKNREKVEYKKSLEHLGSNMKEFNERLRRYPKIEYNRNKYKELHAEVVTKYWSKYNVDRAHGNRMNKNTISHDQTNNVSKLINSSEIIC
jgi:hypothetical protein